MQESFNSFGRGTSGHTVRHGTRCMGLARNVPAVRPPRVRRARQRDAPRGWTMRPVSSRPRSRRPAPRRPALSALGACQAPSRQGRPLMPRAACRRHKRRQRRLQPRRPAQPRRGPPLRRQARAVRAARIAHRLAVSLLGRVCSLSRPSARRSTLLHTGVHLLPPGISALGRGGCRCSPQTA